MTETEIQLCEDDTLPEASLQLCEDGALSLPESMKFTHYSRAYLYQLMGEGVLPYITLGRTRRIPKKALVRLLARGLRSP